MFAWLHARKLHFVERKRVNKSVDSAVLFRFLSFRENYSMICFGAERIMMNRIFTNDPSCLRKQCRLGVISSGCIRLCRKWVNKNKLGSLLHAHSINLVGFSVRPVQMMFLIVFAAVQLVHIKSLEKKADFENFKVLLFELSTFFVALFFVASRCRPCWLFFFFRASKVMIFLLNECVT